MKEVAEVTNLMIVTGVLFFTLSPLNLQLTWIWVRGAFPDEYLKPIKWKILTSRNIDTGFLKLYLFNSFHVLCAKFRIAVHDHVVKGQVLGVTSKGIFKFFILFVSQHICPHYIHNTLLYTRIVPIQDWKHSFNELFVYWIYTL